MANAPDLLRDEVVTGNTPGSPNGSIAATPGQRVTVRAQPLREYAAAGGYAWLSNYAKSLPWAWDDITADFGADIYERMLLDPHITSCVNTLRVGVLEDGLRFSPKVSEEATAGYTQSVRVLEFCERVLDNLDTALDDVLWNMLDAIALGNKVAELVYAQDDTYDVPSGAQALILQAIKVKPRASTAFVVDSFNNTLGFLARIPGIAFPVQHGTMLTDLGDTPNFLPREKFAVMTFRPKDNDPRGTSILRSAYYIWYFKQQLLPEYLKFLTQFSSPLPVGFLPPDAMYEAVDDAEGNPTPDGTGTQQYSDPAGDMAAALATIRNGAALAFPNGSDVKWMQSTNDGGSFAAALDMADRSISQAILHQTLATSEGQHQARAAASVHQDALDTVVRQGKNSVVRMIRRDLLQPLVRYNFGPDWVRWTPQVSLGNTERSDLTGLLNSFGVVGYTLNPSQFPGIDTMLNMPVRDVSHDAPVAAPPGGTTDGQAPAPSGAAPAPDGPPRPAGGTRRPADPGPRPRRGTPPQDQGG